MIAFVAGGIVFAAKRLLSILRMLADLPPKLCSHQMMIPPATKAISVNDWFSF